MESLGGSRNRNQAAGMLGTMRGPSPATQRKDGGLLGGGMGATGRAQTARPGGGAAAGGGARPLSAPRERPRPPPGQAGGSPLDARARVQELRQVKEAQFWGRPEPIKRDLPAYWSLSTYGQPFNDERLAEGATNVYQILDPAPLKGEDRSTAGPATEQQFALRKSLMDGKVLYNRSDLSPLKSMAAPDRLSDADRIMLLSKLTPYQRVHALRNCLDRDKHAADFQPWTEMVNSKLNKAYWMRNKEMAIRLALIQLENLMRRHLQYMCDQRNNNARAPAVGPKYLLREKLWRVDTQRTGLVSLAQFLQVWQNVLCLLEYINVDVETPSGKKTVLQPTKRFIMDQNMCAAIFVKYGFDKDGLMPYAVFIEALCATPNRLLGEEIVLDKKKDGKNGLTSETDISFCMGEAKVIYRMSKGGVMAPSDFDHKEAERSRMVPKAHMWLEHVYGYSGMGLATDLYYTHRTTDDNAEFVYYVGMVGIVMDKEDFKNGIPCQRYFFGHTNDIECLAIHPNRRWVATGQQKPVDDKKDADTYPFVCVWDTDTCNMLQRLDHDKNDRSVIAVCFSGNINAPAGGPAKQGGNILVTVTADDKHTIHVWRWMTVDEETMYRRAVNIPGWYMGPDKKLKDLTAQGVHYHNPESEDTEQDKQLDPKTQRLRHPLKDWARPPEDHVVSQVKKDFAHPVLDRIRNKDLALRMDWERGYCPPDPHIVAGPKSAKDRTYEEIFNQNGCNGTPPMVYGVVWNPLRPADAQRGAEFCSYGVKHLKTWIVNEQNQLQGTAGSFGNDKIENVLSACYVPAKHLMAAPGDSCLLTGFASGQLGLWVPPYPTRPGAVYQLVQKFDAHGPGRKLTLNDGTQVFGGVRVIKLRADPSGKNPVGDIVVTGGCDGMVRQWKLEAVQGNRPDGTPRKGVQLKPMGGADVELYGAPVMALNAPSAPYNEADPARVVALDCHSARIAEFICGTDENDIWEVDKDPQVVVEGHEDLMYVVATHPAYENIFATTCESGKVRVWDMAKMDIKVSANVGFNVLGAAFSYEPYASPLTKGNRYHLAVGSNGGYQLGNWHKVAIMDADTLQPLKILKEASGAVMDIKYTPVGGPGLMAAACQDMKILIYNASKDYQFVSRCMGHTGSVLHIDWSLPMDYPGEPIHGQMVLQSSDNSGMLLCWDPRTGKKLKLNMRDAAWATYTNKVGFSVMGVWPDGSSFDDINSVCRSIRGAPLLENGVVQIPNEADLADGVQNGGYLVTADDMSTVRLFNYPVVWDDAPFKAFRGHASHIMCVRFSSDDKRVLSTGGNDRCVFQWRTMGICKEEAEHDKVVYEAWRQMMKDREEDGNISQAQPNVPWVKMDEEGKVYGPEGEKKKLDAQQERLVRAGVSPARQDRTRSKMDPDME